jgi:hypothetical protein
MKLFVKQLKERAKATREFILNEYHLEKEHTAVSS